jgi:hypothetical protein
MRDEEKKASGFRPQASGKKHRGSGEKMLAKAPDGDIGS